jgi:hypothetical protein
MVLMVMKNSFHQYHNPKYLVGPLYSTLSLLGFNYNLAHTLEQPNKTANQSASLMFLVPSPTAQLPPTMAGEVPPPPLAYMGFALQKICSSRNLQKIPDCLKENKTHKLFVITLCPHKGPLGVIGIK